jgi:hypothetical protein
MLAPGGETTRIGVKPIQRPSTRPKTASCGSTLSPDCAGSRPTETPLNLDDHPAPLPYRRAGIKRGRARRPEFPTHSVQAGKDPDPVPLPDSARRRLDQAGQKLDRRKKGRTRRPWSYRSVREVLCPDIARLRATISIILLKSDPHIDTLGRKATSAPVALSCPGQQGRIARGPVPARPR